MDVLAPLNKWQIQSVEIEYFNTMVFWQEISCRNELHQWDNLSNSGEAVSWNEKYSFGEITYQGKM